MFHPNFGDGSKVPTVRIVLPLSKFDFYRLELRRESLNCPVDRNILLRDKVSEHTTTDNNKFNYSILPFLYGRTTVLPIEIQWPGAAPELIYSFLLIVFNH